MRLQFACVQTKPNLTPWPLRSLSSSQNTGQWQDLHTSDLSIAPFSKFISTTMLFLFSVRSSEAISEQSFRAETLALDSASSSHFAWSKHDHLSDCASVVFLYSKILCLSLFLSFQCVSPGTVWFPFHGLHIPEMFWWLSRVFVRQHALLKYDTWVFCHAIYRGCQSLFACNLWRETEKAHFRRVKKHFLILFFR